jgi:hypothetical protein
VTGLDLTRPHLSAMSGWCSHRRRRSSFTLQRFVPGDPLPHLDDAEMFGCSLEVSLAPVPLLPNQVRTSVECGLMLVREPFARGRYRHSVDQPFAGDALQLMTPPLGEPEPGAHREVAYHR